jgi:hypothetical protein
VEPVDEEVDLGDGLPARGEAIQGLRSGSTLLPSSVDVTVKTFAARLPARAEETATTPANRAIARTRARTFM